MIGTTLKWTPFRIPSITRVAIATSLPLLLGTTMAFADAPRNLITLRGTTACPGFPSALAITEQILPDGSVAPFSLPKQKVLFVTDFHWSLSGGSGVPGTHVGVEFELVRNESGISLFRTSRIVDSFGNADSTEHFESGFAINQQATLCAFPQFSGDPSFIVTVNGFLDKAK